jgi:hypothetical protein
LALGTHGNHLDAIMSAWYPGIGGGPAIAATLFGASNPAGRTASTWYVSYLLFYFIPLLVVPAAPLPPGTSFFLALIFVGAHVSDVCDQRN